MMKIDDMIERVYLVADAQRLRIVGDACRAFEYQAAEQGAQAYKAAGYAGTVPGVVSSWATARGWTNQQAADDILAAATAFRAALEGIRAIRLKAKYDLLAATEQDAPAIFAAAIGQIKMFVSD